MCTRDKNNDNEDRALENFQEMKPPMSRGSPNPLVAEA